MISMNCRPPRETELIRLAAFARLAGSRDSAIEASVKTTKPRLYMRTRPKISPMRPRVTTSTAWTSK
jgi:hypothetical protein